MPLPGAPTITPTRPAAAQPTAAPQAVIPFTRAARKKSRLAGTLGPYTLNAGTQQVAPLQIPANGYIRKLILAVTGTTAGNSNTVAFQADAPWNILQQVTLAAANGDSLINPLDGFALSMVNKYGCFASQTKDPLADPTYVATTGSGATGGSFFFQLEIPFEIDSRDALGSLPNMAANQSFLLQMFLNSVANVYSTAPSAAPAVTIVVTAEYWAAPMTQNAAGIPQQTAPRVNGAVSLLQTQMPVIAPSTDQTIPLTNVGNTIRWIMFILRTAGGVRDEVDWPNVFNLFLNNDLWNYKTKPNWRRQQGIDFGLVNGITAAPTKGALDNGVYFFTDFMNEGSPGDSFASGGANRDLQLVTGSATALAFEAQNWGASAGSLLVITNAIRVPDPSSFYAPLGI